MTLSFLRLTPALALAATLSLGAAYAQNSAPTAANPAAPAQAATTAPLTKQSETAPAASVKKHAAKPAKHKSEAHSKTDKKAGETVTHTNKAVAPTTVPKS